MAGELSLDKVLSQLSPTLSDSTFVFATLENGSLPANVVPQLSFDEVEGTTFILEASEAVEAGIPHEFPCRRITIGAHSALNAIGLLAALTSALAEKSIPVNVVSAFYHDHLFVPVGSEALAMEVIASLSSEAT